MPKGFLIIASCLPLVFAGCGEDSTSSTASVRDESGATAKEWPVAEVGSRISMPDGPPPKKLIVKDLRKGTGPAAKPGDEVEFLYVDALYSSGKVLSVALPVAPFHLELGSHESLPGWEKGIVGMRVGGRRELFIPPGLGFGAEGSPPSVPPNSALLLQVSLVDIE